MIWQNPWAWLGLAAIAIPILIHLLGRDRAPTHMFPTLRFIEIAELPPTRRTRLHDLLLLATRVAIFAVAAAALAQPLLLFASRRASIGGKLARAIIVDTSASMLRLTAGNGRALDSARLQAKQLASDTRTSIVVETSSPISAIGGAVAWLGSQTSQRELVLISDFQSGTVDSAAMAAIPNAVGIRLVPIAAQASGELERRSLVRDASVVERVKVAGDPTVVTWTLARGASAGRTEPHVTIDATNRGDADAVLSAAKTIGVLAPIDTSVRVAVVFAGAPDRDALLKRSSRVLSPKAADLAARLRFDSVTVAEDTTAGSRRLLVFSNDSVANVRSAALLGAIRRALSLSPLAGELDPTTIPSSVIASWQRPPSPTPTRETVDSESGPSDARWLWLIVLALLGVETWLRRERRGPTIRIEEEARDRAA